MGKLAVNNSVTPKSLPRQVLSPSNKTPSPHSKTKSSLRILLCSGYVTSLNSTKEQNLNLISRWHKFSEFRPLLCWVLKSVNRQRVHKKAQQTAKWTLCVVGRELISTSQISLCIDEMNAEGRFYRRCGFFHSTGLIDPCYNQVLSWRVINKSINQLQVFKYVELMMS